jgi:PKD repeat protein
MLALHRPSAAYVLLCMSLGACPSGPPATGSTGDTSAAPTSTPTTTTTTPIDPTTTAAGGNLAPVAKITDDRTADLAAPLALTFTSASTDPDGEIAESAWDLGDGTLATGDAAQHVYTAEGEYTVKLTVTDDDGASAATTVTVTVGGCPKYRAGASQGAIAVPALLEASGLAASRQTPGVVWTHNDTDDDPRLYTFTLQGAPLGSYLLQGADLRDWEDMALGPGPKQGQEYLYVGDIGDNEEKYASITVYRVAEPPIDPRMTGVAASLSGVEALVFTYPGGTPHNAETMIVDPVSGDLHIIGKSGDGISPVFRAAAPLESGVLEEVAQINFGPGGLTTGGAATAAGDWVLVRTYFAARMWRRQPGTSMWQAFQEKACDVPVVMEMQGEAVTFAGSGLDYFTASEGETPPLYRYVRGV